MYIQHSYFYFIKKQCRLPLRKFANKKTNGKSGVLSTKIRCLCSG